MVAIANYVSAADLQHPGVNNSRLQESPIILDIPGAMADDDTSTFTFDALGDTFLPPLSVQISRHTGGDISNTTAAATYVCSTGDTLFLQIDPGTGTFTQYTHTFAGLSAGAATAIEMAASINADTAINAYVRAEPGLTTNKVTLFPKKPRGAVRVVGGTSLTGCPWPGTTGDYKARVYVSQIHDVILTGTGWSWAYDAATRILTIKNETGGTVNRTQVIIRR